MRRNVSWRLLLSAAALCLLLTSCGGDEKSEETPEEAAPASPPETYPVAGEETIPSLTQAIPPIDMAAVVYTPPAPPETEEGDAGGEDAGEGELPGETGGARPDVTTYSYSGLTDAGTLVGS